jgi:WD40 repeat protein
VSRVAFSQDGSRIAAGGINGSTHVWAIASTGSPARSLPGHADAVSALAFSPDGVWLASGANDGSVKIRDFTATSSAHDSSFTYTNAITGKPQPVAALAFSSDGALLSASSYRDITLWNVNDGEAAGPSLKGHAGWIYANAFRLVDHALTSGGDEGAVYMWDSDTGRLTDRLIGGGSDTILAIAVSSDARLLAAGTSGGEVELWDVTAASPVFLGNLPAAENGVRSLAFSADGRWLTATDQVGVVSRWDISESSWRQHACSLANRNLTLEEWRKYIGDPDDDDHDTRQICTEISGAGTAFLTPIVDPAL